MSKDITRTEGGNMVGFAAGGLFIPYLRYTFDPNQSQLNYDIFFSDLLWRDDTWFI